MKQEIRLRIIVKNPLEGVVMQVQRGMYELLPPAVSDNSISFTFDVSVDLSSGTPNFLGNYAQGPKNARFVYVNSGKRAGQYDSPWERRAKISLVSITIEQVESVIASPGSYLETSFDGVGSDGGPTCASVKGIAWKVDKE